MLICHYGNSWAAKVIELKYIFRMGPMENGIICKFVAIMQICNIAMLRLNGGSVKNLSSRMGSLKKN